MASSRLSFLLFWADAAAAGKPVDLLMIRSARLVPICIRYIHAYLYRNASKEEKKLHEDNLSSSGATKLSISSYGAPNPYLYAYRYYIYIVMNYINNHCACS